MTRPALLLAYLAAAALAVPVGLLVSDAVMRGQDAARQAQDGRAAW